ncbi:MAG: hypothetical protein MHMPM18_004913 [Marteilia pararefringens]
MSFFKDRNTAIGKTINTFLKDSLHLSNEAIHLLFSANRHEQATEIREELLKGKTIVCDRYSYSGIAYSHAKGVIQLITQIEEN